MLSKTTVFSDGSLESDQDNDEEESASVMKCRLEIGKLLGYDLEIGPAKVDPSTLRVLLHTPKTGEFNGFDKRYYDDNIKSNDFLRDFVEHHVDFTNEEIDQNLPKPYSNEIKIKLTANAPIR